jgi:hypothetical protein
MVQSNRVTIIVDDGTVYLDEKTYINLDLSMCGIPKDVHALQWMNNRGHIEYRDTRENLDITKLPDWAIKCIEQWEIASKTIPITDEHA